MNGGLGCRLVWQCVEVLLLIVHLLTVVSLILVRRLRQEKEVNVLRAKENHVESFLDENFW